MLKRQVEEMRVVSDDGKEVIVTNEELTSAKALSEVILRDAQHLNLSFNALTSLQGLHVATHLRNLNVSHNALTSLQGVECFQHLVKLRCSDNAIRDLSWLASLPYLREVWINNNCIETSQLAHLATLQSLETLALHPNPCTQTVNYVSYVVKVLPWLSHVDVVVVDDALRQQSQHVDERAFLSSAATDVSEISLMTSRTDDAVTEGEKDENLTRNLSKEGVTRINPPDKTAISQITAASSQLIDAKTEKKKTKKMTAEEFLRAFPVQEFIPASEQELQSKATSIEPTELTAGSSPLQAVKLGDDLHANVLPESNQDQHDLQTTQTSYDTIAPNDTQLLQQESTTSLSAIASAVQSLPLFIDDGIMAKRKTPTLAKSKKNTTKGIPSKPVAVLSPDPALVSFLQDEWICTYPNSTINAIQIRADGSAVAKWPGGSVAVSVDRERDGFRCYAAHKDGTIALSFDADGVGFINYYPSGRMMISTSSNGDGLFFSNEGTIWRQWNAELNMKNDKWESTDKLNDAEPDGSLVIKLSDGLGIRLQLKPANKQADGSLRPSAIDLQVFFSSGTGLRHVFRNWTNKSEPNGTECDIIFGRDAPKLKQKPSATRPTHSDTLQGIRAAVAKLS